MPFAHTPSFSGSHLNGYDVMLKGILEELAKPGRAERQDQHHPGLRRLRRQPARDQADADGHGRRLHDARRLQRRRGLGQHRPLRDVSRRAAPRSPTPPTRSTRIATISLQRAATTKTGAYITKEWEQEFVAVGEPIGINATDAFLAEVSRITGKCVPPSSSSSAPARSTSSSTATPTCTASASRWSATPTCCSG